MIKKILSFLLSCFFVASCCVTASAEEAVPAWERMADDGYPILIDRHYRANTYADFVFPEDAKLLDIWFANIRDADCTILQYGDEVWMIDCGDTRWADRIVNLMKIMGVTHIDRIINTHPHHDHLNGFFKVADQAKVDELLICFPEDYNDHMIKAMKSCKLRDVKVTSYEDGDRLMMGDVTLDVRQLCDVSYSENDRSSVIRVQFGERSALFTADIENGAQKLLVEEAGSEFLNADILKYPHHGKTKLYEAFYEAVDPMMALVFNSAKVGEAPYYLGCKHIPIAYSISNYIHMTTDGKHWVVERTAKPKLR